MRMFTFITKFIPRVGLSIADIKRLFVKWLSVLWDAGGPEKNGEHVRLDMLEESPLVAYPNYFAALVVERTIKQA